MHIPVKILSSQSIDENQRSDLNKSDENCGEPSQRPGMSTGSVQICTPGKHEVQSWHTTTVHELEVFRILFTIVMLPELFKINN